MRIVIILFFMASCLPILAKKVTIAISSETESIAPNFSAVLMSMYKEAGIEANIRIYPSIRAVKEFEEGRSQALGARISNFKDYSKKAILMEPPLIDRMEIGIVSKNSNQKTIDYQKDKFIFIRGNVASTIYKDHYKIENYLEAKSYEQAIALLKKSRGERVVTSKLSFIASRNNLDLKFTPEVSMTPALHHVISTEILDLKEIIEKALLRYKMEGKFSPANLLFKKI